MDARVMIEKQIEREMQYQTKHEVGTEEYNASMARAVTLEEKLMELDRVSGDKKDRRIKYIFEGAKIATGVALPVFGLVVITAQEREITYTSALKSLISCFIPGKIKM